MCVQKSIVFHLLKDSDFDIYYIFCVYIVYML